MKRAHPRTSPRLPRVAAGAAVMVGVLVLIGWAQDVVALKQVAPDWTSMKPNTAVTFILLGTSLWLTTLDGILRRLGTVAATAVLAISAVTLAEWVLGWNPGIDQLLFPEPAGTPGTVFPGRMALTTALCFLALGTAVLIQDARATALRRTAEVLTTMVCLAGSFWMLAYLYDAPLLLLKHGDTSMAFPTSVVLVLLSIGIFALQGGSWMRSVFATKYVGSAVARRLFPIVLVFPLVGWLRLAGQRAGLFETEFGVVMTTFVAIVLVIAMIVVTAAALNRAYLRGELAEAALGEAEERFRATFEQAAVGIAHVALDGHWLRVNQRLSDIVGYSSAELAGLTFQDITYPPDLEADLSQVRRLLAGEIANYSMEKRYVRKDGSLVWINLTGSLVHDAAGHPSYFIAVVENIQARKLVEAALETVLTEARRSNEELERFAYVASHDLQEPLRSISGFAQLLLRRYTGKLDSDADEFIGFMLDGTQRMQALINALLAYSRIETGAPPLEPSNLNHALDRALANLATAIANCGAIVTHTELPILPADATQMEHLFQNFIGNAIRFRSVETPRVHVCATCEGDRWTVAVRDNGIGIERKHFDRIFGVFQQLQPNAVIGGTGIGLAICKRVVERHGGTIWLESEPGTGTTFFFTLPRAAEVLA